MHTSHPKAIPHLGLGMETQESTEASATSAEATLVRPLQEPQFPGAPPTPILSTDEQAGIRAESRRYLQHIPVMENTFPVAPATGTVFIFRDAFNVPIATVDVLEVAGLVSQAPASIVNHGMSRDLRVEMTRGNPLVLRNITLQHVNKMVAEYAAFVAQPHVVAARFERAKPSVNESQDVGHKQLLRIVAELEIVVKKLRDHIVPLV